MQFDFTELFANGMNIWSIIIAVTLFIAGNALNSWLSIKIKQNESNAKLLAKKDRTIMDLKNIHPIFNDIKYYKDVKVPTCRIGGPVRTIVFKDCLTIYYDTCYKACEELLNKEITTDNFLTANKETITSFIVQVGRELENNGIPAVVIEKFQSWHSKRNEYILTVLADIDASDIIDTLVEKEFLVLSIIREAAYFTLLDAEKTLKNLNGQLSGVEYKGMIIEPLHR